MAPTSQPSQDPAITAATSPQPPPAQPPPSAVPPELPSIPAGNLDQNQIMTLLRHLPNVFKLTDGHKDSDAAQTLSNLSQSSGFPLQFPPSQGGSQVHPLQHVLPMLGDPGPSSHPRGPPNLGQLSALALQAQQITAAGRNGQVASGQGGPREDDGSEDDAKQSESAAAPSASPITTGMPITGGRRGGRNAAIGSDEWARQRKDNHKEVERRRRGNINEGINELGRIVPNGSGEKAKGAILARAVQYIHHLKENEARNIEKWTLEKLLMDQAMGDLQSQLGEVQGQNVELQRVKGEMERQLGEMQSELVAIKTQLEVMEKTTKGEKVEAGTKRRSPDEQAAERDDAEKRQKTNP